MIIGGKRMNLVGDKIYLRNIEDEDINVLKTLINDENVNQYHQWSILLGLII